MYIFFALLFCYISVLLWLAYGFLKTPLFKLKKQASVPVTIIICARNEEKNIAICLHTILKQNFDLNSIQLILINDASHDNTVQRAEQVLKPSGIRYSIISNVQQKGKKQSINYAMQFAEHELIVQRDADTFTRSQSWLQSISDFYRDSNADMIIAPIAIADNKGLLWALQAIENNVLSLATCGSAFYHKPFLCNGANLAFKKSAFIKVKGYASHLEVQSGDDVLLMEDIKRLPENRICFLKSKDAIVYTYPLFSFKKLIHQKIRWASKFKVNKSKLNLLLSVLSFLVNLIWFFCLIFVNKLGYKELFLLFIYLKLFIDILLLFLASGFIKNRNLLWFCLPVGFIYPVYAGIVGIASLFIKPRWK